VPFFATRLKSLRPHLLRTTPVAFRRRNIFADSTIGARTWEIHRVNNSIKLTKADIQRLLDLLNVEMAEQNTVGEIYIERAFQTGGSTTL
jgi:hypothetical protein